MVKDKAVDVQTQTQTPQGLEIMSGNAGWMVLFKDAQSQKGI